MGLRPLYLLLLQLLLQLLATWQVAETQPVLIIESVKLTILPGQHVASGTDVTLQCDPKITSGTGTPLKHRYTFYRDSTPVYAKGNTTASSLPYVIRQARVANSGSYKCSVAVHGQYKESDPESLNVTGLQTPVLLLSKATVTEGEGVTASCSAPKETGSSFFFYFEGSKEPKKMPTSKNLAETQLKFSSPGNKSVTCQYRISLQPDLVTSSRSKPSRVYVQELSIRPHIEVTPSANVIEGDELQIACRVDGSRHKPSDITVYVSKDGIMKANGKGSIVYNTTVQASDSGLYECKAIMGDVVKAVNRSVAVSELFSRPVLTMKPPEAFEKESFSLTCYSHNISTQRIQRGQVKYSLYRNGEVLTPGDFGGNFSTTAEASRNGNYSCDAVAKHIRKSSNVIVFKAKGKDQLGASSSPSRRYSSRVKSSWGSCSRIHCHCENGSLPVSYTLLSNRVPQPPVLLVRQPKETASFLVTVRRKEDVRNFTCEAENNGYSSRKESEVLDVAVTVLIIESVKLTILPGQHVASGTDVTLQCDPQNHLRHRDAPEAQYVITLQPDLVTSSKSKPSRVYVQGDRLQIACPSNASRHKPSDITVYVSKDAIMKKNGKGSIVYRTTVQTSDSGLYECKAMMGDVVKAVSRCVAVSATTSPPSGSSDQVKYSLYRNGRVLTPGDFGGKFNTTAEASRNGNYSCDAVAKHIRKSSNVIVFKAKAVDIRPGVKSSWGSRSRIHCHCENGSLPVSYTLLSNRVPQPPVLLVRQPNDTASFLVTVRRKEDVRNFTCEAENNGYSSRKESEVLDVAVTGGGLWRRGAPLLCPRPEADRQTDGRGGRAASERRQPALARHQRKFPSPALRRAGSSPLTS
ncbi:hypothetical protein ANANG_G00029080 [Anguilla anguilla]|uniref:Ig-like domain-containing protein n=1 Tax=Anguilla anguilla TaxID=7936 RepID=A0A9D3MTN4_ANGAN|nr:hypothetical protein ANANG_G00029080 [Anguilla anguilla]